MKEFRFVLEGTSPMIVHNGGNISPLSPANKLKKEFTGKKKKTDDDHMNIARIEWYQSLYLDSELSLELRDDKFFASLEDGRLPKVVLPLKCIRACVKSGAKLAKNGKAMDRAVQFAGSEFYLPGEKGKRLEFPDINSMSDDNAYVDVSAQSVQRAKVMRYRGKFNRWACEVTGYLAEEMLNPDELVQAIQMAGKFEGMNDSRSMGYGRFELMDFKVI